MSSRKLEKTLTELPDNVLESIILFVAPSRIQWINKRNFGNEVHALSQCCRRKNNLVNRSRLKFQALINAAALKSSWALQRPLRYADKHKCNWILERTGIAGVVDMDVADFDHFICLLNENPQWVRDANVGIRVFTISSIVLSEQTKTLIRTWRFFLILFVMKPKTLEIANSLFPIPITLLSQKYISMVQVLSTTSWEFSIRSLILSALTWPKIVLIWRIYEKLPW